MASVKIHLTAHVESVSSRKQQNTRRELHRSQLPDQRTIILPVCSVRRVWCREDGSVWSWWAFSAGNNPLEEDNRFLFLFLYPLITKWMHCHTWLMGPVAYHGPWSICEHFNSNTENCMSKYQRVMPRALAFSAERGYPFLAHICQKHFLTAIRSHADAIYSTSSSPKAFVSTALLPLFCFSYASWFFFSPTNTNAWLYLYGLKASKLRLWAIDYSY